MSGSEFSGEVMQDSTGRKRISRRGLAVAAVGSILLCVLCAVSAQLLDTRENEVSGDDKGQASRATAVQPTVTEASALVSSVTPLMSASAVNDQDQAIRTPIVQTTVAKTDAPAASVTPSIAASATSLTGSATPAPAITEQLFESNGLGLDRSEWDRRHKRTGTGVLGDIYDGIYEVAFMDDRVWYIELSYESGGVTLDQAKQDAVSLLPLDAVLLESYSPEDVPELQVELYGSDSLANRFVEDLFIGGEPGDFIVAFAARDGHTSRVVIGIGNNP